LAFLPVTGSLVAISGCLGSPATGAPVDGGAIAPLVGCGVSGGNPPATAPNGYYTNGGSVCTADGKVRVFHGVDRPSLEWSPFGDAMSPADFALMASWGANVVRIALNQDFWLSGAALYEAQYPPMVDNAVAWAEAAGLDVILDLHWSDLGDLGAMLKDSTGACLAAPGGAAVTCSTQQTMGDNNSIEFWKEVADRYKGDGHVLFELYNEPHGISWDLWLNGGSSGRYVLAGMQQLYDAVRGTGANNVVIAGGLSWAYDLSAVGASGYHIDGYNIMYATHPYSMSGGDAPGGWEGSFGHLETSDFAPVIATEFGDGRTQCTGDWDQQLIRFADNHHASWTAWAWYPGVRTTDPQGCLFPALISDWSATPTVQGVVVKAALGAYTSSLPRPALVDAGADGADAQAEPVVALDAGMAGTEDAPAE
jgi:endoglucanase